MWKDVSLSAIVAGLIAVTISYAGPALIIFQAGNAAGLSQSVMASWIWAVSIGSGVAGLWLSYRYKAPVITAWSTPGAALLLSCLGQVSFPEVIGAYCFASFLILVLGMTGGFDKIISWIPKEIAAAMLAGILFRFASETMTALHDLPMLVVPMFLAFLVLRKLLPRYAILLVLCVGVIISAEMGLLHLGNVHLAVMQPVWTTPQFSLAGIIGIGLPLAMVTITGQFVPGIAVMQNAGYETAAKPMVSVTSLAALLLAPFGAHGINLAAITAAICTGRESHEDPKKRYIAGIVAGAFYIVVGMVGGALVALFAALPKALVITIAGLALLGALMNGLAVAMSNEQQRESALITFVVTASGVTLVGLGAPFWGLIAGMIAKWLLEGRGLSLVLAWKKS
ncbi:benzoate/H(+) symporter BenE family transporter [Leeia sp. TBRC 13508]|uniref:Benzoate/H(+) symporter BenE family transporter n=1 Tax=Leeia speluncae TaxID=2884804 RepID=A0ABS8DAE9_9NEIS|nr:benzoate/H(+) symporter BenE family transporter [Leeia speluncae]MCB6184901.1 benzoate/H(+) symporter BenE family transporter [Leeia speluncae]